MWKALKRIVCLLFLLLLTGAGVPSSEQSARQLLDEVNLARTDPRAYAVFLRELRRNFKGKLYRVPGSTTMVLTGEGVPAVDEAIRFLGRQRPVPPLNWSQGLADAAAELVMEQGQTAGVGHSGPGSGDMEERVERHGVWHSRIAENIGYGPETARLMVMELIIDDRVPDRGHRRNIFNRHYTLAGAACGKHPRYRYMCVMDFAEKFKTTE